MLSVADYLDALEAPGQEVVERPDKPPLDLGIVAGHLQQCAALHVLAISCARKGHGEQLRLVGHVDLLVRLFILAAQRIGLFDRRGREYGAEVPPARLHATNVVHPHVCDSFVRGLDGQYVVVGRETLLKEVHLLRCLLDLLLAAADRADLLREARELLLAGCELLLLLLAVEVDLLGQRIHAAPLLSVLSLQALTCSSIASMRAWRVSIRSACAWMVSIMGRLFADLI